MSYSTVAAEHELDEVEVEGSVGEVVGLHQQRLSHQLNVTDDDC